VERARGALVAALAAMLVAVGCAVPGFLPSAGSPRARSVILISGDGMGPAHIEAARRDRSGLELDRLAERGRMVTGPPADGDATVTDSAAAATAWSTGTRTTNGSVGVDPDGDPLPTFGRAAEAAGRATGLVTTAAVTDASPAAFFASVPDRTLDARIARQYVDGGGPDVVLGGGRGVWNSDGLLDRARAAGYRYADDAAALGAAGDGKLLGLFADGELWRSGSPPALATLTTAALGQQLLRLEPRRQQVAVPLPPPRHVGLPGQIEELLPFVLVDAVEAEEIDEVAFLEPVPAQFHPADLRPRRPDQVRGFLPADPGRFATFPQLRADSHPQHCGPDAIARLIPQHPEWHGGLLGRVSNAPITPPVPSQPLW